MKLALIAVAAILAGCTRLPPASDGLSPEARTARIRSIDSWEMRGRLAVDTGDRAYQARFRWQQSAESLSLTVRGFLGAGSFRISGTEDELTLLTRGDEHLLLDPEQDLSALFGWWLPVTSLKSWLLGLTDPRHPIDSESGGSSVARGFEQRLWQIRYDEFQLTNGLLIPRHALMEHTPLAVELTVDDWSFPEAAPTLN